MIPLPKDLKTFLRDSGIEVTGQREIDYATQYYLKRETDSASLNVYRTGKVVPGGKSASGVKRELENYLTGGEGPAAGQRRENAPAVLDATPRLGIDEAGKGDYFGPLVVAGARILNPESARKLRQIGVRDSKALSVSQATRFAELIVEALGRENVRVSSLQPRTFEERRRGSGNVNVLLGELDAKIMGELKDEVECMVVDEFARATRSYLEPFVPAGVRLEVRSRAEDDAAVAAASILARARFLEDLERLSEEVGFELPRGATHVVDVGKRVVEEYGTEGLKDVAKVSFGTTKKILGRSIEE